MSTLIGAVAIVALVAMNAYFVAAEFSPVAVRKTQIELWVAEGRRGAAAAAAAIRRLDDTIAATQLGITVCIGLGFVGEPALAGWVTPLLALAGIDAPALVHPVALVDRPARSGPTPDACSSTCSGCRARACAT